MLRSLVLLCASMSLFLISGCSDNATGPGTIGRARFYINDATNRDRIYVYDLESDSLSTISLNVDQLGGQPVFGSLASSPRRHSLYIGDHTRTVVYDADLDSIVDIHSYGSYYGISVSPDDKLVALCGESLLVVSTADFSVVFHDSARTARPVFSRDSKTLFAVEGRAGAYALIVQFGSDSASATRRSFPAPLWRIRPSYDGKLWYVYTNLGGGEFAVAAYNPREDAVKGSTTTSPGLGDLTTTPDGRTLIYSSSGSTLTSGPNPFGFFIVDLQSRFSVTKVSTSALIDQRDSTYAGFRPSKMALSHDGRFLALAPPANAAAIVVYDLRAQRVVRCWNYTPFDRSAAFLDVVCLE